METDQRSIDNKLENYIILFLLMQGSSVKGGVGFESTLPSLNVKVNILTRKRRNDLYVVRKELVQFEAIGYSSLEEIPENIIEKLTKERINFRKGLAYEFYITKYMINPIAYDRIFEIYDYPAESDSEPYNIKPQASNKKQHKFTKTNYLIRFIVGGTLLLSIFLISMLKNSNFKNYFL